MNHNQKLSAFDAWYFREFEVYPRRNESGGFKSQYVNAMFKAFSGGLTVGNGGAVDDGQSEPTMPQLEAFIKRAGFTWGWRELESWARRMAEQAVLELNQAALASPEVQALCKDAERYQWLREHGFNHADVELTSDLDGNPITIWRLRFYIPEPSGLPYEEDDWTLEQLDAAIDAAMEKQNHD